MYAVIDKEADIIVGPEGMVETIEEGRNLIEELEREDMQEDIYIKNFYKIVVWSDKYREQLEEQAKIKKYCLA